MDKKLGSNTLSQGLWCNPPVEEVPVSAWPRVNKSAVVGSSSLIIGDVTVAEAVFIGFYNVLRADSGAPFYIGPRTNIQDFVIVHSHPGQHLVVNGKEVAVYIEGDVSILHHAIPHGPLFVGRNTYIGHHVSIYGGSIGRNCVIMHHATISNRVTIADNRYVPPGQVIENQLQADNLPVVPPEYLNLNAQIVEHYCRLGKAYQKQGKLILRQTD